MYQNFYYSKWNETCHIWDDENGYYTLPYKPYAYQVDPNGEYTTLTGLKVKKVNSWSDAAVKQGLIFEHDVITPTRVLVDEYFESDDVSTGHRVMFFDIEVKKGEKYSLPKDANNVINAIAYAIDGKYTCLILDEEGQIPQGSRKVNVSGTDQYIDVEIKTYQSEERLLGSFIIEWSKINPTIVTSWNGDYFDVPYLCNRIEKILGKNNLKKLSPIGIVEMREQGKNVYVKIAGVSQMDYLQLYKKFTYNEESSYTLESIAQKELKRGKIKYDGTLDQLYHEDVDKFVEYNVNDVELICSIDKKMDLIEIARGICHAGHVPYDDYAMSSRYLEGALLTYCKRIGKVAFTTVKNTNVTKAKGAFVKPPNVGIKRFIYDLDLESEYPNNIKTLNISPETKWGRIDNEFDVERFAKDEDIRYNVIRYKSEHVADVMFDMDKNPTNLTFNSSTELRKFLVENNLSISSAGILYDKTTKGIIPNILTVWGDTRKDYRKTAAKFHEEGDHAKYVFYDRKQLVQKILLNSLYGVLLLPTFRFYDKENGESTTLTGQSLVQWSARMGNLYYKKLTKATETVDYCVYSDTDSIFLMSLPIIDKLYSGHTFTEDELVAKTLELAKAVEDFVNKSYDQYAKKYHNCDEHTWRIKQEMVGKRGFWGSAKKRYAMYIINKNGLAVDEYDIKGFDSVRSSFPKLFRKMLKETIIDVLHDADKDTMNGKVREFKRLALEGSLFDVMKPTSVKEMSKYLVGQKGTPVHVKSAQNYNILLKHFKIESIPVITDGDKIMWIYLRQNPYGFNTMALKGQGEDPQEILDFVEKYADRTQNYEATLHSALQSIWDDLGWEHIQLTSNNFF